MKEMITGFKTFLVQGNLIELAVAFVMGLAFAAVVNSLVENLVTPIIAMIIGEPSLSSLDFEINNAVFRYGAFLDDVIAFLATAAAVYFFIVIPYREIMARMKSGAEPDATTKVCPECANAVPIEARRCGFCTSPLATA